MKDCTAGVIARTRTINDQVPSFRKQRWIIKHLLGSEPYCPWDDHRIAQQVEGLTNVNDEKIKI
jgi:hypothetical protein